MTFLITGPWLILLRLDWRDVVVVGLSSGSDCARGAAASPVCTVLVSEVGVLAWLGMLGREVRLTRPRAVSGFVSAGDVMPDFFTGGSGLSFFVVRRWRASTDCRISATLRLVGIGAGVWAAVAGAQVPRPGTPTSSDWPWN